MATFANLSDIVSTTIQNRSGTLADNVTNNNALLMKMKERGNVKPFSGGNVILQEIMYNDTATERCYGAVPLLCVVQRHCYREQRFVLGLRCH